MLQIKYNKSANRYSERVLFQSIILKVLQTIQLDTVGAFQENVHVENKIR